MFGVKKIDRNQIDTTLLPVLLAFLLVFFTCSVDARDNNSIVSNPDWHNQTNPQWGSGSSQFTQQPSRSITPTGSHQTRTITVRESKPQTNTNTTAAGSTANQAPPQTNTQSTNFSDSKDYARLYSAAAAAHDAGNTQEEERIIQSLPEDQRAGARVFVNDGGVTPVSHAVDVAIAVGGAAAIATLPETTAITSAGVTASSKEPLKKVIDNAVDTANKLHKNTPKPSPKFVEPTNPPSYPPTSLPEGHSVRVMPATEQYPNGYWRETNQFNQPINPATGKPGTRAETHIPLPPPN